MASFRWAVILVCVAILPGRVAGQVIDASRSDDQEKVRFALTAMRSERLKLVSGICRYSGTLLVDYPAKPDGRFDGPVEGFVAFDHEKLRFDFTRPGWVIDPASISSMSAEDPKDDAPAGTVTPARATAQNVKGMLTQRSADDGTRATIWLSVEPLIAISQSKDFSLRSLTRGDFLDFRCPTVLDRYSINKGRTLEEVFDNLLEHMAKFPQTVTHPDPDLWLLTFTATHEDGVTNWHLLLNAKKGFTPERFRCETARTGGDPQKPLVEWEIQCDWQERDGIYVPVRYDYHQFSGPYSGGEEHRAYRIEWESVNQPVDPELFTYRTFRVPEEVAVQDASGGTPVWIKPLPQALDPNPGNPVATAVAPHRTILIVINSIFLIGLVGLIIWKRRSSKSNSAN